MINATQQKVKDNFAIIYPMSSIKAIILDVDGVIIGEKIGFNSPYPNKLVTKKLREINSKGVLISLCTAKPHWSVQKIIDDSLLNNIHITQGGAVLINPINNIILEKHVIDAKNASMLIDEFLKNNVYTEFYSLDDYFIQENQKNELTKIHTHILQKEPTIVNSLVSESLKQEIVKIMPVVKNEEGKKLLINLFEPFKENLTLSWGIHPIALPHIFGIITSKGISKKQSVLKISKAENISPNEILAIGDSTSDWQFIEQCGYGGAMGNATDDLKKLVLLKGKVRSFIGKSVDENGILDIFNHFGL